MLSFSSGLFSKDFLPLGLFTNDIFFPMADLNCTGISNIYSNGKRVCYQTLIFILAHAKL